MGGVQAVSGVASIVFACGLTSTVVGAPLALGIAAIGFDNLQAGSQALLNNQPARTLGGQALELTGLSSENAELAYSIFDLAATIKVIRLALTKGGYQMLQVNIGSGMVDRIKLIRAKINQRHHIVADELKVVDAAEVVKEVITGPVFNPAGAARAAKFGHNWQSVSAKETIKRIAGEKPIITYTESGKTIYTNGSTGMQVVYDNSGKYFRVENPAATGHAQFTDQFGKPIPSNVPLIQQSKVTQTGVPSDIRNALTHFKDAD